MNVFDLQAVLTLEKNGFDEGLNTSSKKVKTFGDTVKAILTSDMLKSGFNAIANTIKSSVKAFGDYEQLVGGIETLFGAQGAKSVSEYAQIVGKTVDSVAGEYDRLMQAQTLALKNADDAYMSAGMSANEYMSMMTSFAASLKQSTGDNVEAAKVADVAMQDMSDKHSVRVKRIEPYQGCAA